MSDMPHLNLLHDFGSVITKACPRLVRTANQVYFAPPGKTKLMCRGFNKSPTFVNLRQQLVLHIRSVFCDKIVVFMRGLLDQVRAGIPEFEVRVDDYGYETCFLLYLV
jgi:hypothetical protein